MHVEITVLGIESAGNFYRQQQQHKLYLPDYMTLQYAKALG